MKLCKNCAYFLDSTKEHDPLVFETWPRYDRCLLFFKIEPVRGLKICVSCVEARDKPQTMCGATAACYIDKWLDYEAV